MSNIYRSIGVLSFKPGVGIPGVGHSY